MKENLGLYADTVNLANAVMGEWWDYLDGDYDAIRRMDIDELVIALYKC